MQLIPLSKLDQSEDNVCKRPNPEFEERLSFDIEARGVLQNLIVAKAKKRGRFEVIGGGKRMRAMHRIVERGPPCFGAIVSHAFAVGKVRRDLSGEFGLSAVGRANR